MDNNNAVIINIKRTCQRNCLKILVLSFFLFKYLKKLMNAETAIVITHTKRNFEMILPDGFSLKELIICSGAPKEKFTRTPRTINSKIYNNLFMKQTHLSTHIIKRNQGHIRYP